MHQFVLNVSEQTTVRFVHGEDKLAHLGLNYQKRFKLSDIQNTYFCIKRCSKQTKADVCLPFSNN